MSIRLLECRLRGALVETRVPFRFGIAEITEMAHVVLFATMEVDGRRQTGVAADNLAPKWFTKNPATSYRDDALEMIDVIESACSIGLRSGSHRSVFDLWHSVYSEQVDEGDSQIPPLLASFGVSLVERAAIDGYCRAQNVSFRDAVRANTLGIRLGTLHTELTDRSPAELLPPLPLSRIVIRHTVGLGDSLVAGDGAGAVPHDNLPSTLGEWIQRDGLRRFKVKVSGERRADLERLGRIGSVLETAAGDYRLTIDGNEQFADVTALQSFWEDAIASAGMAQLHHRIDYVEQPLPRELALSADTFAELEAWPGRPRLIIDESDDSLDAVSRAIDAGYDGGAFKSSKGVFKGIGNACLIAQARRANPARRLIYSAEDSSTIPPIGLLADLAVIATLGIEEPERNGHHYFRGLARLPQRVEEETVRHHGDLFSLGRDGRAMLRIEDGEIAVDSVIAAPFGVAWRCDFEEELDSADSLVAALA